MRLRIFILVFALACLCVGCNKQFVAADKGKPAVSKDKPSSVADKDIYQALLDYISANISTERKVVFSEQAVTVADVFRAAKSGATDTPGLNPADKPAPLTQLQALLPAIPPQLATNFMGVLQAAGSITKSDIPDSTKIKPILVSDADLIAIFKDTGGWQRFHDKFAGVKSLVKLSRPAIDPDSDLAIVYLGVYCGNLCGEGDLFLIAKLKGRWLVVHKQRMWTNHD